MTAIRRLREFICQGCGKEVKARRSKINVKYCSLKCWRTHPHPQRKNGKFIRCGVCGKECYRASNRLKVKNSFCSLKCANEFQKRNKLVFECKICHEVFRWSASRIKKQSPMYCSIKCRNADSDFMRRVSIKANLMQLYKKGLNMLELRGRAILEGIGLKKDFDFNEQVLLFDKFLVDVYIPSKKLIIQWDGVYWHSKTHRKDLDTSQDAYARKAGLRVLRFTDEQIKNNEGDVIANIKEAIR